MKTRKCKSEKWLRSVPTPNNNPRNSKITVSRTFQYLSGLMFLAICHQFLFLLHSPSRKCDDKERVTEKKGLAYLSESPPFLTTMKFISPMPPTGALPHPVENASNFDLSSSVMACVTSQNHLKYNGAIIWRNELNIKIS